MQNFAQAQPGQPPPPWEQQRPSFSVYRRVHYGMVWGMGILSVGIFLRVVRFYAAYQLTDEATGLNCIELRVACEQQARHVVLQPRLWRDTQGCSLASGEIRRVAASGV